MSQKQQQKMQEEEVSSHNNDSDLHALKTFYIKTDVSYEGEPEHQLLMQGKYHNYLKMTRIKSRFCLGNTMISEVTVDDTYFFNPKIRME